MKWLPMLLLALIEVRPQWIVKPYKNGNLPMVWVDGRYRYILEIDTLFDRVCCIVQRIPENKQRIQNNQQTGVVITSLLVLTTFNPLRSLSTRPDILEKMWVNLLTGRIVENSSFTLYHLYNGPHERHFKCCRQVIPTYTTSNSMRHGPNYPIHDLAVLRLHEPLQFIDPVPVPATHFEGYLNWPLHSTYKIPNKVGFSPIRAILAKPGEMMYEDDMKFASVGHITDDHIAEGRYLELGYFGAIVDCEEWFPREWGHFICLQNTENYPGLASGATLFSGEKLFGLGAFVLKKGELSILVFTDVRPYWHLFYRTCTEDDQALRTPADLALPKP